MSRERKRALSMCVVMLVAVALAASLTTRAQADDKPKKKMTYCAYYDPEKSAHVSYCSPAAVPEAQKQCDAKLKQKKIEGTCECTDDQDFIADRCK
jgi:hypothetical protein